MKLMNGSRIWMVFCAGLLVASWSAASPVHADTEPTTEPTVSETVPPAEPGKVKELALEAGLTSEQLSAMRTSGLGWGEIKIAISLAQKLSTAEDTPLPIGPILDDLLAQRQQGMGWGEIAQANGFKLGEVVGKGQAKKDARLAPTEPTTTESAPTGTETMTSAKPEGAGKLNKPEKVEKPVKMEKAERLERPERPEKPAKAERPDKPERPEKHHRGTM